jgi:hypothetical protein
MLHAKLSPSSSHRWLACPGSVQANWDKPHEDNVYALEGTTAHALLEVCLRTGDDPNRYIGKVLQKGLHEVNEAMVDGVGYALDYITAYTADHPGAHVLVEEKLFYGESIETDDELAFGFADVIIDDYPHEVVGLDYKHGIGNPVSVKENSQLRLYMLGMRQRRGRYQRYRAVVVQPRLPKRKPVQEAPAISDKELEKWVGKTVIPVVPVALGSNGPRVAGSHCRYCHANGNCPAQYKLVMDAAAKEFKNAKG